MDAKLDISVEIFPSDGKKNQQKISFILGIDFVKKRGTFSRKSKGIFNPVRLLKSIFILCGNYSVC
jgi:hypothetical protein